MPALPRLASPARLTHLACLTLLASGLVACTDDEPGPPVALVELSCGRPGCDGAAPIAVGGRITVQPAELGRVASITARPAGAATLAPVPASAELWEVTALAAGPVVLELRDEAGDPIGEHALTLAPIDHLQADLRLVTRTRVIDIPGVTTADHPDLPHTGTVEMTVSAHGADGALRGVVRYAITPELPAPDGRVLEQRDDGVVRFRLGLGGDNAITFQTGALVARFGFWVH